MRAWRLTFNSTHLHVCKVQTKLRAPQWLALALLHNNKWAKEETACADKQESSRDTCLHRNGEKASMCGQNRNLNREKKGTGNIVTSHNNRKKQQTFKYNHIRSKRKNALTVFWALVSTLQKMLLMSLVLVLLLSVFALKELFSRQWQKLKGNSKEI